MLKGNLSTRPFYNERLVALALGALLLVAASATLLNARQLITLSQERSALRGRVEQDQAEATRINADTLALQQNVDRTTLRLLAASTHEANSLIARRTFSWTAFFGLIERTLPFDVRLVAVSPRTERGVFHIAMHVIARDLDDVDAFTSALLDTGAFRNIVPSEQRPREDGSYGAVLEAQYFPTAAGPPAKTAAPAPASQETRP
jgi:hypothetical protein